MIRVFNGDALAIQEDEYDWRTALHYFLDGHKDDYVIIYRGAKPVKTLSYHDVCYNREVPELRLYLDQDIFAEARKYFFAYEKQEERWRRAVVVCNRRDEAECILYYQHNQIREDFPVSEFRDYAFEEDLDFELISRADVYIIEEYEEYTAFINQPGILVAKLKGDKHDYHDEMPYLAVLYLLAECNSLISNCKYGAFVIAEYINGGTYKYCYCCTEK